MFRKTFLTALAFMTMAATARAQIARDAIDLSTVAVYNSPQDVASWPITQSITGLRMRPSGAFDAGLSFTSNALNVWPDYWPPGWDGPLQYTVWAVVNVNGHWYTSGFIQMWRGRVSTGGPILTDFAMNWAYDGRWGPMQGHQPVVGEQMGFFLTAGNARGVGTVTSVRERTNVVMVSLPAGDYGDFTFSGTVTQWDFNGDNHSDLVVRNYTTGDNVVYFMNGTTLLGTASLTPVPDVNWRLVAIADMNGDGKDDLIFRHAVTGENVVWYMNGVTVSSSAMLPTVADMNWQLVGAADINRDGKADLVWRHAISGSNAVWFMNGSTLVSSAPLQGLADRSWQIVAVADMNRDGSPDLIWRNFNTGENGVWYLNGVTTIGYASLPPIPDISWQVAGAIDVNGDGMTDLLWRNTSTGANAIWYLNGTTIIGTPTLPSSDIAWRTAQPMIRPAARDFNGDTHSDLLWRNVSTGSIMAWLLNGPGTIGTLTLPSQAPGAWQLVATADLNLDGKPDLLWRNTSTGANQVWLMNGSTIGSTVSLTAVPDLTWRLVAAADLNGDGRPDLIWRNTTSGQNVVWFMNGTTLVSSTVLPTVADQAWQIADAADMNGDGSVDLIWRNTTTGENAIWYLNRAAQLITSAPLQTVADQNWKLVSAIDVDGDGATDLVWRNVATGTNAVWYMNNTTMIGVGYFGALNDPNWVVIH